MSILHRMIFFELAKIFLLSLLGITGILVMAGIVAEASQQGLNPAQILMVIPLLIPSTLPYTIPATTLFATCLVYGRLAHDNEILAVKAAGINLIQVIWPGVFLGLLMSGFTMGLYYYLIPHTHHLLRSRFLSEVEETMYAILKRDRCLKQPGLNYTMAVRQVQGRRLLDPFFKRQDANGNYDIIAHAREAELHVDLPNRQLLVHMRHGEVSGGEGNKGYFVDRIWAVDLPPETGTNPNPRPRALSWQELLGKRKELSAERERWIAEMALAEGMTLLKQPPLTLAAHIKNVKAIVRRMDIDINCINAELQMRPALSFGCLFFVLVGCPVGIWFSRSDYLSAFITCFVPVVLLYYPLLLCSCNLAKDGKLPPFVALWAADAVMAVIASILFRQLLKH